jgi:hypothetical protein
MLDLFDPRITNPFSVRVEPHSCIVKSKENPQPIAMPVTITGRLQHPGDSDVYQLSAKKGEKLSFRLASRSLGFPLDPVLKLSDAAGKTLAQTKAAAIGADATLAYTAPQEGVYRLEVSDLYRHGSFRHVYRLDAGPILPDFELKIAGDMFRLAANKPLDIPVTITRLGGHKQEVALSVEGLPKEIQFTATAKGITLRREQMAPFAGPIRIVGTAKDGARHTARATITELGRTADSLWLSTSLP